MLAICSCCGCLIVFVCISLLYLGLNVDLIVSVPKFTYLLYTSLAPLICQKKKKKKNENDTYTTINPGSRNLGTVYFVQLFYMSYFTRIFKYYVVSIIRN